MNKWVELLVGLILVIAPIIFVSMVQFSNWLTATKYFIEGGIVVGVVLIGLLFIMLGISDLKG